MSDIRNERLLDDALSQATEEARQRKRKEWISPSEMSEWIKGRAWEIYQIRS